MRKCFTNSLVDGTNHGKRVNLNNLKFKVKCNNLLVGIYILKIFMEFEVIHDVYLEISI